MTKISIIGFGCSSNISDSEAMAGLLKGAGFEIVDDVADAYIVIINSCTVKGNSNILRNMRSIVNDYPYKQIILSGCVTSDLINEARKIKEDISVVNTHNLHEIVTVVEETLNENYIEVLARPEEELAKINLPKIRKNPIISIIPISSGCVAECSYCSVRLIKGKLFSYPIESILKEAEHAVRGGCRELWITSQDTAAYGMEWDGKSHLPELLRKLVDIKGSFLIRLGMGNPSNFIQIADEIAEIMKNRKMFKFLHIPIQSGNDEILKAMNRSYTVEEFLELVARFRAVIPNITISTDMICGFPGETDEQFKDSMDVLDKIKPDHLNRSRFQPRPGTKAAAMKQLPGGLIKDRSRAMSSKFDWLAYESNRKWKAWHGSILIDEAGKDGTWVGRNSYYRPVIVEGNLKMGDIVTVSVIGITKHDLRAELVNQKSAVETFE